MPTYTKPGVYVEENLQVLPQVISGNAPSVAAFIGVADHGPATTSGTIAAIPTLVTSWSDFTNKFSFGALIDPFKSTVEPASLDLKNALKSFFENGGSQAYVTRLVNTDATTASATLTGTGSVQALTVKAKDPGQWGNNVWTFAVASADAAYFDLYVYYSETATTAGDLTYAANHVEHFSQLSMNPSNNRYALNVVVSNYITLAHPAANTANIIPTVTTLTSGVPAAASRMSGGGKGVTAPAPSTAVLPLLDPIFGPVVLNWPKGASEALFAVAGTAAAVVATNVATLTIASGHGIVVGDTINVYGIDSTFNGSYVVSAVTGTSVSYVKTTGNTSVNPTSGVVSKVYSTLESSKIDTTAINAALAYAAGRGDVFVVVDAPDTTATNAVSRIQGLGVNKNFGAAYFPHFYVPDSTSTVGATKKIAPGGAVTAMYANADATQGTFKSPAGVGTTLNNVVSVQALSNAEFATISNSNVAINVIRYVPGAGICIMGARTMSTSFEDRYVVVRRSLQYLNRVLTDNLQFAVFEANDEVLWSRVRSVADDTLNAYWRKGGLKGATNTEAYYVKCDASINNQTAIDAGELRVEIGVALQKPAEFIIIKIGQTAGGLSVTTSV